jgi:hypothetical protein
MQAVQARWRGLAMKRERVEMEPVDRAKKGVESRTGAVLMETLLVLPLYMVLFGGILWMGDLILAKQSLVIADRFAAWTSGNRSIQRDDVVGQVNRLFFPRRVHPNQEATLERGRPQRVNRWWDTPGATVRLRVTMPEWIRGWFAVTGRVWFDDQAPDRLTMTGRDVDPLEHHVVVMRSRRSAKSDYPRSWTPRELADRTHPWSQQVYEESWPMKGDNLPRQRRPKGEDYTRYKWYVKWSS